MLRPIDAVVAWLLNAGVPILAAIAWFLATGEERGDVVHSILRLTAAALLVSWLIWARKVGLSELRALYSWSTRPVVIGAAVGLALFTAEYVAVVVWQFIDRTPNLVDGRWNPWVATRSLAGPYAGYFLALVVVAPLVEEFVHRGVAFPALRSRFGVATAAVVSSLVFALGHEAFFGLVTALVSGLVYVWLVERYRSLAPAIASHVAGNLAVFVFGWALYNLFGIAGEGLG
jgi:membrane protease YdiL (CAAX protease family)